VFEHFFGYERWNVSFWFFDTLIDRNGKQNLIAGANHVNRNRRSAHDPSGNTRIAEMQAGGNK
jgi:hypothetical protein